MVELCSNGDGITIQGGVEMDGDGDPPGDRAAGIPLITDRCAALAFLHGVDTSIREAFHLAYLLYIQHYVNLMSHKKLKFKRFHHYIILHLMMSHDCLLALFGFADFAQSTAANRPNQPPAS